MGWAGWGVGDLRWSLVLCVQGRVRLGWVERQGGGTGGDDRELSRRRLPLLLRVVLCVSCMGGCVNACGMVAIMHEWKCVCGPKRRRQAGRRQAHR